MEGRVAFLAGTCWHFQPPSRGFLQGLRDGKFQPASGRSCKEGAPRREIYVFWLLQLQAFSTHLVSLTAANASDAV